MDYKKIINEAIHIDYKIEDELIEMNDETMEMLLLDSDFLSPHDFVRPKHYKGKNWILQTDWMDDKQHKKVLTILGEKT
jgi:hypothetical protein